MLPMVANDEVPNHVAEDAKQKVVWKAVQVDAAKVAPVNGERFEPLGGVEHEAP